MAILKDLSICWSMLHAGILLILLFRSRFTGKKTAAAAGVGIGILTVVNAAVLEVSGMEYLSEVFLFTYSVPAFLLFYVMSAERPLKLLFTFCLANVSGLWVMAATSLVDDCLGGGYGVLMFAGGLAAYPLAEYYLWRHLRKCYLELQDAVEQGWGVLTGMTVLYGILLVRVLKLPADTVRQTGDMFLCVLLLALMQCSYAVIFSTLYGQLQIYRKQQGERLLQEQKHLLDAQLENQQHIRRMKHDIRRNMAALSGFIEAGKLVEASVYLKSAEPEQVAGPFCSNSYVNAVLVHYDQKFQELGIELMKDIRVGEEELPYMELCQILSNGLDNAWDASRLLAPETRDVRVQMCCGGDGLLIRIKNRCSRELYVERGTLPKISRRNGRGFGLLSVQEAAARLDAEMLCYTDGGWFVLDVTVQAVKGSGAVPEVGG